MAKVLVSDPIDQVGVEILSQVAQVDVKTGLPPLWEKLSRKSPKLPLKNKEIQINLGTLKDEHSIS